MARTPPPVAQEKLEPATVLGGKDSDSTPWPEADFLPCLREAPVLKWMLSGEDYIMWGPPPFPPVERPDFYEVFETMVVVSAQPVRRPSAGHRLHRGITRAFVTRTCYQTVTHYPIPPGRILVPIPAAIPVARAHVEAPRGEAPTPAEPTPGPSTTAPPAPRPTPPATQPASPARVVPDPPVVPAPVPAPTCRPRRSEPPPEPRAPAPKPPQPQGRGEATRRRLRDAVSEQRRREREAQRYMAGRSTAGAWVEKNRTTGMVRFFDKRKGYGFATQDYTGREVFIPRRSVKRPDLPESQHNLKPGECIEFSLQEGPRGPWAAGVIRKPPTPTRTATTRRMTEPETVLRLLPLFISVQRLCAMIAPFLCHSRDVIKGLCPSPNRGDPLFLHCTFPHLKGCTQKMDFVSRDLLRDFCQPPGKVAM
ncbi:hypothetical protein GDO81_024084 [Engystomops pustulosus]|uniref:CSD domain-containing protein n=1 Tax=Engystomops pustulosus TaxID=76066 RepID=A0AAV6YUK5_ENGPU|nr:hypothetical protein GDO81_024084 [Engystomops pustulosus]